MGVCSVRLMGGFEVRVDGDLIPGDAWRSRRAADLVKVLALEPTHEIHREEAMDLLWPELRIEAAGANLRKAIHYARRAMGAEESISAQASMLSLWRGTVEVDALRFLVEADAALAAGDAGACARAADLYTGELVPADRYESWVGNARARMRERYLAVLKGAGRWQRVLDLDPTDEESHRALMRVYHQAGRRREAMRQFERLRDALREFMGVGPDPDTIALYEQILDTEGDEPPTPAQRAAVLIATGLVHLNRQDFGAAERLARQAKAMALDAGLGHELGDAGTLLALVSMWTGRWNEVFREEFIASLAYPPELAIATGDANACFAEYHVSGTDALAGATDYARELLALALDAGSDVGCGLAQLMLGEVLLFAGDLPGARAELQRAVEIGGAAGFLCGRSLALERLAEVRLALADREGAEELLEVARPAAAGSALRSHLVVRLLGVGVQVPSEPQQGLAAVVRAERVLSGATRVCDPCSINFRLQAASACARGGDLARSRKHLADAERVAGLWQGGPWSAATWEARAALRLAEGQTQQAAAFLREAADGFAKAHRPIDEARCRAAVTSMV